MPDISTVDEAIATLRTVIAALERERQTDTSPQAAATATAIEHIQHAVTSLEVVLDAGLSTL